MSIIRHIPNGFPRPLPVIKYKVTLVKRWKGRVKGGGGVNSLVNVRFLSYFIFKLMALFPKVCLWI